MRRFTALIFALVLGVPSLAAPVSSFNVGDVSVIGLGADNDDQIAFVIWQDIDAGESLHFTDSGFFDDGTIRDSETILTWTNSTGGVLNAGTTILITNNVADQGTTSGSLVLATSGDQIFVGKTAFPDAGMTSKPGSAYAGADLLFGINVDGAGFASDATNSNNTALPTPLNVANGNVAIGESDNVQYSGARTGLTVEQFKAAVTDPTNWTSNNTRFAFSSADFTIVAVPEPGSFLALAVGTGVFGLCHRRRVSRTKTKASS